MSDAGRISDLLELAASGDSVAARRVVEAHRKRLRQMVAIHLDGRLRARVDPSDIVQEALAEAMDRLPEYLRQRPVAFYPWLRRIAWERLVKTHRLHTAGKRSVDREEQVHLTYSGRAMGVLAERLVASGTHPSERLQRDELRNRVRRALDQLPARHREALVLRFLEQLSLEEAIAVLGISEAAFMKRQTRAIQRLRTVLDHQDKGRST